MEESKFTGQVDGSRKLDGAEKAECTKSVLWDMNSQRLGFLTLLVESFEKRRDRPVVKYRQKAQKEARSLPCHISRRVLLDLDRLEEGEASGRDTPTFLGTRGNLSQASDLQNVSKI